MGDLDRHAPTPTAERMVYVVAQPEYRAFDRRPPIDFIEFLGIVWINKWLVVLIAAIFSAVGIAISLSSQVLFRAEVVLAPAEKRTGASALGQLGSLASLAGINVGAGGGQEPLAVLRSRDFSRRFIERRELLPIIFSNKWQAASKTWKEKDASKIPDLRDAVRVFQEKHFAAAEDKKTGLVTVTINWRDPVESADLANDIVRQLNNDLRTRSISESERNIAYLRGEMSTIGVVSLQQSLGRLLESELQKLMLAKGNEEFAFKVIDKASPPKKQSSPRPVLITLLSGILGSLLGAMYVLLRHYRRAVKQQAIVQRDEPAS
jgi:uncharacterized protein involved in exopolysaccharide biosynthesis